MRRIDPQAQAILAEFAAVDATPPWQASIAEARADYEVSRVRLSGPPPAVAECQDLTMPGAAGPLSLRCYRPVPVRPSSSLPAIVYFHGGGWALGSLQSHDALCRRLALASDAVVIAVDYRLAPESKFPAAVEDALSAVLWVRGHCAALSADPSRIVVAGDSAGGNLAAVVALQMREQDGPPLAMQVLIYPALDQSLDSASHRELADGYLLTRARLSWFRSLYLRSEADISDWRASPLRAPALGGLPRAYVITAGFDPLRDEGEAYAIRLREAGVVVTHECFEGMIHGFLLMSGRIAAAHHAVYRIAQQLRPLTHRGEPPH